MTTDMIEKPKLLSAIELVLAKPEDIKREAEQMLLKFSKSNPNKPLDKIQNLATKKIISNYSYFAAFAGGATGLTGVVPGIGTAAAMLGGGTADVVLTMKYQIEMTMAIATVYGHDILMEEEKRLCYLIAGLGAMSEAAKKGGKVVTSKAFVKMAQTYLKGATLQAIKEIFKKIGVTFTRAALEKAIPFGVGVVIGFAANKGLTWYVGTKARDFFIAETAEA